MNRLPFVLFLFATLFFAACKGASADIDVTDVWGRNSPMAAENGAFYMIIENNTTETEQLLSVSTPACEVTELHEMYMKENDVMGMRPVEGGIIVIPAGEKVELKVGGLHVMCLSKTQEFVPGEDIPLLLEFANAGEMEANIEIRESAGGMEMEEGP
jgi:copper(I)-binding protein